MSNFLLWCTAVMLLIGGTLASATEPVPVATTKVAKQSVLQEVLLNGTVTSPKVAQLSVSTPGLVATLRVNEGDFVSPGDILLELDSELVKLQWQSSEAAAEQAKVAFDDAQRRLEEAKVLVKQKNIAATTVKDRIMEVASNKAGLHRAQATAAYQKALLDRHTLRAPFAGVIANRLTELGEWVAPGSGVYELVSTEGLRLDFSVAETYLAKVSRDAQVNFTIAGIPDQIYQGVVQTVVPVTDPKMRTFLLRVGLLDQQTPALTNTNNKNRTQFLPGMSVQARLVVPTGNKGIVIPRDAILRYPDGRIVVWEVIAGDDGQIVAERQVKLGASYEGFIEISEGLSDGASIVVRGNEALRHGQAVKSVP